MRKLRAIVGARVSAMRDEKVSHLSQQETGLRYAEAKGWDVIGAFNDLGVSATVRPFDRPDLGKWLSEEHKDEWDVIVWAKVDRAFRSSKDCADIAHWAKLNNKQLHFTDDGIVLNYGSGDTMGEMMSGFFLQIASLFGEMELRRFQDRAKAAQSFLRTTDRWPSGVAPTGYCVVEHHSGKGKGLAHDPDGQAALHRMADMLLNGASFTEIASRLNADNVQSNRARVRGQDASWTVYSVQRALTSPRSQGIKVSNNQIVRNETGEPIRVGEPSFDDDTWDRIQNVVKERTWSGKRRVHSENPLLGIGYCGECGASLTRKNLSKGTYYYYACGRSPKQCAGVSARNEPVHRVIDHEILSVIGHLKATRRVFVPGSDSTRELEDIEQAIEGLRAESDAGLIRSARDRQSYVSRMSALMDRRDAIGDTPMRAAGWVTEYEEETYRDKYENADDIERREIVKAAGIKLYLFSKDSERMPMVELPTELENRLGLTLGSASLPDAGTVTLTP